MSTEKSTRKRKPRPSVGAAKPLSPDELPPATAISVGAAMVILEAGLEIKDVEAVSLRLLGTLAVGRPMTVDLSRIAAIDTAGVQLLIGLRGEAARRGVALEILGHSPALVHALATLGVHGALVP